MSARRMIAPLAASFVVLGAVLGVPASAQQETGVPGLGASDVPGLPGSAPEGLADPASPTVPGSEPGAGTLSDGTAMDSGAPALGVRPGEVTQPELLPGILDSQIKKCWSVPVLTGDPAEGGLARIRVALLPDGTLAGPPAIIDKPAGRLGAVFAESAAAAIAKCAPYTLPPESYQTWREMMIVFDTLDF